VIHEQTGTGVEALFRRYDSNGGASLDAAEFEHLAEDLGFSHISHDLFIELDPATTGALNPTEIGRAIRGRGVSRDAKRFLLSLADSQERRRVELDTSSWRLTSESADAIREQLVAQLAACEPPARASDLFAAMARGGEGTLDSAAFALGFARLGLPRARHEGLLDELFMQVDKDGSGHVSKHECVRRVRVRPTPTSCRVHASRARHAAFAHAGALEHRRTELRSRSAPLALQPVAVATRGGRAERASQAARAAAAAADRHRMGCGRAAQGAAADAHRSGALADQPAARLGQGRAQGLARAAGVCDAHEAHS
jgi:hypothetical protein